MKKAMLLMACIAVVMCTTGCPANQQQQAAQASENAAVIVKAAQAGEITAFQQGLIPAPDHQFIEQQFASLAGIGKTVDACVAAASTKNAVYPCLNTAIKQIDQINSEGGTYLKSATAKQDFSLALTGVRTVLASIEATMGGTPPPVPAS